MDPSAFEKSGLGYSAEVLKVGEIEQAFTKGHKFPEGRKAAFFAVE